MKTVLLSIMKQALKSIESLEHFYETEYESIEDKSASGKSKYRLGWAIDTFFSALAYAKDAEKSSKGYRDLEQMVRKEVSYKVLPKKGTDRMVIRFRYKNKEKLKRMGIELDIEKAADEFEKFVDMPRLHGCNTLIMLVTRFEEFIARLIAEIYRQIPQRYLNNESVCLSEIEGCSFAEIKEGVVDRLVNAIMRDKYSKWFELFAEHGLDARAWVVPLDGLREVYARRNIIVHNAGVINREYIAQVPCTKYKRGVQLEVSKRYIDNAFLLVREMIFMVMLEASNFLRKEDVDSYLYAIFEDAFDCLVAQNYALCTLVFGWLKSARGFDENQRSMAQVNYWLSKIGDGACDNETTGEVEKFDVSAKDECFKVAKCLLLQNYDEATKLLDHQLAIGEMSSSIIMKWPLFKKYRQTKFFESLKKRNKSLFKNYDVRPKRVKNCKACKESLLSELRT